VQTTTVAIIDDHPITRSGLSSVISDLPGFSVACSLADGRELTADSGIDMALHDLYLADGRPSVAEVGRISGFTRVLVMSASRHPADVLAVVRAGARGYVVKDTPQDALAAALTTVALGGFALSPNLADILAAALAQAPAAAVEPTEALSPRESEALDLIAAGFTHAQAARRMGVTKSTVDTYVERIRTKLQAGNKAELTRLALRRGAESPAR